jgi:hypothetical protein
MKTFLFILVALGLCFAGAFEDAAKKKDIAGTDVFTSIKSYESGDSIVIIETDLVHETVTKTVYVPKSYVRWYNCNSEDVHYEDLITGSVTNEPKIAWGKIVVKGHMKTVPEHEEIVWDK